MSKNEKKFIEKCFETLFMNKPQKFVNTDSDKLIKSTVTMEEVEELENRYSIKLPSIFCEYLCAYFYYFNELEGVLDNFCGEDDKNIIVYMFSMPKDNPLSQLKKMLEDFVELVDNGYIPIGDLYGWGPICFDRLNNNRIIWFDHDEYYNYETREELEDIGEILFENFYEFMECFFCGEKYTCNM